MGGKWTHQYPRFVIVERKEIMERIQLNTSWYQLKYIYEDWKYDYSLKNRNSMMKLSLRSLVVEMSWKGANP